MTAQVQEIVTRQDVDRAWQEQIIATDLYEIACMERQPRHVIEQRREDMVQATKRAQDLQAMYNEQYDRRMYDENGRWTVQEMAVA